MALEDLIVRAGVTDTGAYLASLNKVVRTTNKGFDSVAKSAIKANQTIGAMPKITKKSTEGFKKLSLSTKSFKERLKEAAGEIPGFGNLMQFATNPVVAFTAAAVAAGKALFELGKRAVQLDAIDRKVKVVFGDGTKEIEVFAATLNKQLGESISTTEALLASTQDLIVPLGFQRDQATQLTKSFSELATSLAITDEKQRGAQNAFDSVNAALVGSRERLREYGITLLDADIQAKKAELGLSNLTREYDVQATALATLELIYEKNADNLTAAGAAAKGLAGQLAAANADFKEAKDLLSRELLPVVIFFTEQLALTAQGFKNITVNVKSFIKLLGGSKAAYMELENATASFFKMEKPFTDAQIKNQKRLEEFAGGSAKRLGESRRKQEEQNEAVSKAKELVNEYAKALSEIADRTKKVNIETADATKAIREFSQAVGPTQLPGIGLEEVPDITKFFNVKGSGGFDEGGQVGPQQFITPDVSEFIKLKPLEEAESAVSKLDTAFNSLTSSIGSSAREFGRLLAEGGNTTDVLKNITTQILAGIPLRIAEFLFQTAATLGFPAGVPALLGGIALSGFGGAVPGLLGGAGGGRRQNLPEVRTPQVLQGEAERGSSTVNVYMGQEQMKGLVIKTTEEILSDRGRG